MMSEFEAVRQGWKLGFRSLEAEIVAPVEMEVRGALPAGLEGTLFRNGPARLDVYGERLRHWFDGDGMIHALRIEDGRATYQNRFVATPGKAREDGERRRIYANFGTPAAGGPITRYLTNREHRKNPANTNIVSHADRLLALCEAGRPYRLDPATLETLGEDDMSGALGDTATYSAHPKLDPATGEMWNFGVEYGRFATVHLYCTSSAGQTRRVASVQLPDMPMLHDFALTATKAVFVITPALLPRLPLGLILGQKSFGGSLRYRPEVGTTLLVIDRATGEPSWFQTESFMMFHVANAWDDGADVLVDLSAYPDGGILRTLADVMVVDTPPRAHAYVERLRLGSRGRAVSRQRLSSLPLEFPRVWGRRLSTEHRVVYGVTWAEGANFLGQPAAIDLERGTSQVATMPPGALCGECVPVSKPGATTDRDVWLLTLVLDPRKQETELWVLDGADLAAPPVARVKTPHIVPFGFHGNWRSSRKPS
jgi:all-trans-8'-apo-beta-carotenal 15,15'-oxygenase